MNPDVNYSKLAESMGWWATGPIKDPAQLGPALKEAIAQGVVVVQSSRAGSGRVFRGRRHQENNVVVADNLNPQKARILLSLALTKTQDKASIAEMFANY